MIHTVLAAQSSFSIGRSIIAIDDLVKQAKEAGATAVALTDVMSVTGMIDFTNQAKKAGLKPIVGCQLRLVDDPTWRRSRGEKEKTPPEYFVTAYVLKEEGLKALFRLLTLANSEERFYYSAKLGFQDLYNELGKIEPGSLAITTGDVNSILRHPNIDNVIRQLDVAAGVDGLYINLTPINTPYWDALNIKALKMLTVTGRPIVTRPIWYQKGQAAAAAFMNAVSRNVKVDSTWFWSPANDDMHVMGSIELLTEAKNAQARIKSRDASMPVEKFGEGLRLTEELVDRVSYAWSKAKVSLPVMAPDEFRQVAQECINGWKTRFASPIFGDKPSDEALEAVYRPRLRYELEILRKLGFSGYFLLVQDIVRFAKSNGILVGPGRGSVGGSLVAYLMGITDCDPIRFGLLFERFINPDRIDLPDADLDFMSARRGEIVDYLTKKYGQERVAGISNFNSLAAASTIRDVGKVAGFTEDQIRCSKYVEKSHGQNIKLVKQVDLVPEIKRFSEDNPGVWKLCLEIEGAIKSMGRHAAGVVVGGCDLVERAVIERRNDGATVNWDKDIVESQGLVKVDILGLETLDLIALAKDYIAKRRGKSVNLMEIPLDDPKVLENFAAAKTTGIFQFESGGMRRLLKELGRDGVITFDDITAATALYRPGPMESGMMDSYWKRKQGSELVEYDHPLMEPILKPTFGVMVYQEQVMQISRVIAGYSAPDADKLRKIMGKKLPEEMKKERGKFVEGCVKTVACTEDWAGELFDKIEGFAGYGFNKSHSVEYTLISYQAMWLKTNFPVEFYAAALSLMKDEKLPALLKDVNEFGIKISVPDVNYSTERFEILTDTNLCIPFSRVKWLTDRAAKMIVDARNDGKGPFKSISDFNARLTDRRLVNVTRVEILSKIGAFASIEPTHLPSDHPDRIKDQRELIPGLIADSVPIKREMHTDDPTKIQIVKVMAEYRELAKDGVQVKVAFGKNAKFMAIFDAPTSGEERAGIFTFADSFTAVSEAMSEAGLSRDEGYWTGLLKRPKEGKQVSAEELKTYLPYLDKEIALLKPPVIVLLGSTAVRQFLPGFKGKASESAGKVVYIPSLDANVVIGFNPGEIFHDPEKQIALNEVFAKVASLTT